MNEAPETSEILAFVATVDAGSVSGAAKELAVPRATVGRRLGRLEERLGLRLLHRTTRSLHLTEAGEEYYRYARVALQAVESASAAVRRPDDVPRGLLRVSIPPAGGAGFTELLLTFVERYPEVELEVIASSALLDLRAGNIDVALRAAVDLDPGLIARRLLSSELIAVASPAYLAAHGAPSDPSELANHQCLLGFARGERPGTHWPLRAGGQIRVRGRLVANDLRLLQGAAVRGLGIALLPSQFSDALIARGLLVPVLPAALGGSTQIALVYPDRRMVKPAVRAFVDHIMAGSRALTSPREGR